MVEAPTASAPQLGVAWAATLAAAFLLIAPIPLAAEEGPSTFLGVPQVDKLAHLLLFLFLGWIWRRSLLRSGRSVSYLTIFAAVVAYGGLLELLQGASGIRTAEWGDFAADALGAGLVPLWRWAPAQGGGAVADEAIGAEAGPVDSR